MPKSFPILASKNLKRVQLFGYFLFFVSLVFAIRPLNSIVIALLVLTGLLHRLSKRQRQQSTAREEEAMDKQTAKTGRVFWISCMALYLLYGLSLIYTSNIHETLRHLQLKSSLVFVPLMIVLHPPAAKQMQLYTLMFVYLLVAATIICLFYAGFVTVFHNADAASWFYHKLVSPFKQHAVLFSLLIFFALTEVTRRLTARQYLISPFIHSLILVLFTGFLFLLSSKLIISGFLLFILWFVLRNIRSRAITGFTIVIFLVGVFGVFLTSNPISERFREIAEGDMALISQPKFNQGTYFNGLQFRLLQWKNVAELLKENNAYLLGLSPGDAQEKLNQKYISKDMYTGTAERGERGFLGYNTHNQFLESTLHLGLAGLVIFLVAVAGLVKLCLKSGSLQLWFIVGILLAFCCTESVLETQYGLVVFTFFPLFFYYRTMRDKHDGKS